MKDSISRWIDGDLTPQEAEGVMKRLLASEEGREEFTAYAAIGDAMRCGDVGAAHRRTAIFAALASEPTVFVPGGATSALRAEQSKAEVRRGRGLVDSPRFRAGFAAAASVVTVGVVGWLGYQDRSTATMSVAAPQVASAPVGTAIAVNVTPAMRDIPPNVRDYLAVHRQIPSAEPVHAELVVPAAHIRPVTAR